MHGEHIIQSHESIEQLSFIQPSTSSSNNNTNSTAHSYTTTAAATNADTNTATIQPTSTSHEITINDDSNDLALYLLNRIPAGIQVMHIIRTSYCETECCFQYVRTTKTKTNLDPHTINTIEVYRGRRPNPTNESIQNDTINETYI